MLLVKNKRNIPKKEERNNKLFYSPNKKDEQTNTNKSTQITES